MKSRLLLLLCACSSVNAEPWPLPPAVDDASYPSASTAGAVPGSGAAQAKPASANTMYELMGRLEQLQVEVQQLTGKVEEQTYLITDMKKRQSTMYADFDERIQALEKKLEGTGQAAGAGVEATAGSANTAAPSGQPVATDAKTESAPATEPAAQDKPAEPKQEAAPVVGDSKQPYQHAYDALRSGLTSQAISEFKDLLSKNPNGEFASNAQYWLGEAYRVNQDVEAARSAFNAVVDHYPGSPKVPDAMLKLGYIEMEQKNIAKARDYLTKVTVAYPESTAAHLAAKKLLVLDQIKDESKH